MDGIATSKKIFEICSKHNLNITIIACSAFESKEEISKCLEIGMKEFIKKPITYFSCKKIIENWLN